MSDRSDIFTLYGAPFGVGTSADTSQGIDSGNGPAAFRKLFDELYANYNIDTYLKDGGDIKADQTVPAVLDAIRDCIAQSVKKQERFVLFGGAHTVTLGTQRGIAAGGSDYSLIYFDAHPDLMPEKDIHYGTVLYHAMEEKILLPERTALIGIRHIEKEENDVIKQRNIKCIRGEEFESSSWRDKFEDIRKNLPPPYFLSIDLDSLDPTIAPGVTTPAPFGLELRELLYMTKSFCGDDLLGIEVVELAPKFDLSNQTARIAAGLVQELTKACCK